MATYPVDPDVRRIAKRFGVDPYLIQAVVQAEGDIFKAVRCSIPTVKDRDDAIEITCRSAVHALSDFVKTRDRDAFVEFWGARWAPVGATNDPTKLNANWPKNVKRIWARALSLLAMLLLCVAPAVAQDGGEDPIARPITSLGVTIPLPVGTSESVDRYHRIPLASVKSTLWTHACVVATVTYHRREADGDVHLRLEDRGALIVAEIIPQIPLPTPRTGARVEVCGITRFDRSHGWAELHPVTSIKAVPR